MRSIYFLACATLALELFLWRARVHQLRAHGKRSARTQPCCALVLRRARVHQGVHGFRFFRVTLVSYTRAQEGASASSIARLPQAPYRVVRSRSSAQVVYFGFTF
ncbi:hypothetical protein NDU88_003313 [Pleurodeles waltl]|uniref:Secreted protein n=1 Tax=Pleurodeles waltl TaxID=8319 RepID=A0AAV7LMP4_PLEWA|nr:hypothetical protein NDU88_003313 [Pleurodeles waltl]